MRIVWRRPHSAAALVTPQLLLVLLIRLAVSGVAFILLALFFGATVSALWLAIVLTGVALLGLTVVRDVGWHIAERRRNGAAVATGGMEVVWSYARDDLWPLFTARRRGELLGAHPGAAARAVWLYLAPLLLAAIVLPAYELIQVLRVGFDQYSPSVFTASAGIFTAYVLVCLFLRRP